MTTKLAARTGLKQRLARKTESVKNKRCRIRYSPSNAPGQALHGTHRQIPQRRGLHTVAGGAKPVPSIKLNSEYEVPRCVKILTLGSRYVTPYLQGAVHGRVCSIVQSGSSF